MRCGIYVRCFYESFYLDWFIEYYLNLGFDYIIILKADDIKYVVPKNFKKKVYIKNVENIGNKLYDKYFNIIRYAKPDWVLMIDIDEILILKNNNIKTFLREKLKLNKNTNCFYFKWLMMERYDNKDLNLKDSYNNYKLFNNNFYKSMSNLPNIKSVNCPHSFKYNKDAIINYNDNIVKNLRRHHQLSEYNYSYDNYLLHIHTRSINNLVLKSLITILGNKHIHDINNFKEFVNNFTINDENILEKFKDSIGQKAKLPYSHSQNKIMDINKNHHLFNKKIVNFNKEKEILYKLLNKNKINIENYELMTEKLEKEINNHFIK